MLYKFFRINKGEIKMVQIETKIIENIESEFIYDETIQITSGFYNKYYGKVISYDIKTTKYNIEIIIKDKPVIVSCTANQMRHIKKFFGR